MRGFFGLICLLCVFGSMSHSAEKIEPPRMLIAAGPVGAVLVEHGRVTGTYPTRGQCQDAWFLEDHSVLVSEKVGVTKYKDNGDVMMRYTVTGKRNEVHACQPLPGGGVLLSESGPPRLIELDATGKIVKEIPVTDITFKNPHLHVRGTRKNDVGEYGVVSSGEMRLLLLGADGQMKKSIDLQKLPKSITHKFSHAFAFLKNGHVLASTSYGSCFVELDENGDLVWSLTPEDVPELGLTYAAGMHRLSNGNTICTANKSLYPIFEVTPDKTVVWKIKADATLGAPLHVQALSESKNPSRLKVER